MKSILQSILAVLARATIRKYKPIIIGITGSVGKTSTKAAIFAVLNSKWNVRTSEKNYNNEIGLPLTILGIPHYGRNILGWLSALIRAFIRAYLRKRKFYPKVLVLEYAVDRPRDMDYLLSIAKPQMAVVTGMGEIPVHVEFFKDPEELIKEKTKLVKALSADGIAVLNHDDLAILDMGEKTRAKKITYGLEKHANVKIANFSVRTRKDAELGDVPDGTSFKIEHEGDVVPFRLHQSFGMPQVYAAAAAAAVGLEMDMNLVEISEAITRWDPPPGRLRLLEGIKKSWILDDTYNAAPESMRAALDTLEMLPGKRKIAVLGDMLEIGKYSEQAHRAIGDRAAQFVDVLFTVGPRAKFITDEFRARRSAEIEPRREEVRPRNVESFDDSVSAGRALDPMLQAGDVVLVKGSQALRMEKAVLEIMRHPELANQLLVRQDEYWKRR